LVEEGVAVVIYLYRWKIKSGKEKQFEDNWAVVTNAILLQCGSYGSRLHISEDGEYVGYAQWPDVKTRDACDLKDTRSKEASKAMVEAIDKSYPPQILEVKTDFLIHPKSI
jgi:hypothetical protein